MADAGTSFSFRNKRPVSPSFFFQSGWLVILSKSSLGHHGSQYFERDGPRTESQNVPRVGAATPEKDSFCLGQNFHRPTKNIFRGDTIVQQSWHDFSQRKRTTAGRLTGVDMSWQSPASGGKPPILYSSFNASRTQPCPT